MKLPDIILLPLQPEDREQFILDNQWAFKYGAQQEFGMRDDRCEEGEEVISRKTIVDSIDGDNAEAYRIVLDGEKVGGVVLLLHVLVTVHRIEHRENCVFLHKRLNLRVIRNEPPSATENGSNYSYRDHDWLRKEAVMYCPTKLTARCGIQLTVPRRI